MTKPACRHWEAAPDDTLETWHPDECAMCGGCGPFVTDHDHHTGLIRGRLCRHCNAVEPHSVAEWWDDWRAGINPAGILGVEEEHRHVIPGAAFMERMWREPVAEDVMDRIAEAVAR